jgi:hypothetical protein
MLQGAYFKKFWAADLLRVWKYSLQVSMQMHRGLIPI